MKELEGGCLCGKVRIRVEGDPIVSGACYCRDCQYVSGGGAAYGQLYSADAITITRGQLKTHTLKAESGAEVLRQFCADCGVHLVSYSSTHSDLRSVKTGTLDDPSQFEAQGHVWTSSAQPWHHVPADLPSHPRNPPLDAP